MIESTKAEFPAPGKRAWVIGIPNYHPPLLNTLIGCGPRIRSRRKSECAEIFGVYAAMAGVPLVTQAYQPRRRVFFLFRGWKRGRVPDEDAFLKASLDALVTARVLVDDSRGWCVWERPVIERGDKFTTIAIEDME